MSFLGPTARQDAETSERNKWLDVLADILFASPTRMGALLREDPASRRILGAGRRAGTVRARVRSIRKILAWLAAAHELPYPTSHMHLVEFLQVRHSEPVQEERSNSLTRLLSSWRSCLESKRSLQQFRSTSQSRTSL